MFNSFDTRSSNMASKIQKKIRLCNRFYKEMSKKLCEGVSVYRYLTIFAETN